MTGETTKNYDHSEASLGLACGFEKDDSDKFRNVLLKIFTEHDETPSRAVEAVEQGLSKRAISMLLVGSILASKRLESLLTLLEQVGGEDALRAMLSQTDYEEIG